MATYVVLSSWTNEGARAAHETVQRAEKVRELVKRHGGELRHIWWTMGRFDVVAVCDAPDDETMTAIMVGVAQSGAIRSETLRAFDAAEMSAIVGRVAG